MAQDVSINEQAASLTYLPEGSGAIARSVRTKINELGRGAITDYGAVHDWSGEPGGSGNDDTPGINAAYAYQAASRTHFDIAANDYFGLGRISFPKGYFRFGSPITTPAGNVFGLEVSRHGPYATTASFNISSGGAFAFQGYSHLYVPDMYLKNESSTKGTSAGIDLNGLGGGEYASFKRLSIVGFNVAIRTNGKALTREMATRLLLSRCASRALSGLIKLATVKPTDGPF